MRNTKTTEILETREEIQQRNEQQDRTEQRMSSAERRKLHPVLLAWLCTHPSLFQGRVGGDLGRKPSEHPHVKAIANAIPQVSLETATKMAWLVWRAGQIQFWTRNLDRDTYATENGIPVLLHRGVNTVNWEQALAHAELRDASDTHELAFKRRTEFYAKQDAARENEESIALILGSVDTRKPAQGPEDDAETDRLKAQKSAQLDGVTRDSGQQRATRQANAQADATLKTKEEAEMKRLRGDGVKIRKGNRTVKA